MRSHAFAPALAAALAAALPAPARAQDAPAPAVEALAAFLNRTPRWENEHEGVNTVYTRHAAVPGPCVLEVRQSMRSRVMMNTDALLLDLVVHSPDVLVEEWSGDGTWTVRIELSSRIHLTRDDLAREGPDPRRPAPFHEIVFTDAGQAEAAARLAREAILACGGRR